MKLLIEMTLQSDAVFATDSAFRAERYRDTDG